MRRWIQACGWILGLLLAAQAVSAASLFDKKEYAARRSRLMDKIPDVTGTFAGPDEVLTPGFVFACDIQLFRVEEEIGIRLEDTIAITETGYENLSLGVPRTVQEVEALMRADGILQILKKKGFQ
jgi:Xaa-Pro aminopeptidase